MIEFMVIAAPRSGTAWAANWLTTDTTLCLHDPLWQRHYRDLDAIPSTKMLGVACTGLAMFPRFLLEHPARKVILHRDRGEIDASLATIGMPPTPDGLLERLDEVIGMHMHWSALLDPVKARCIYEYLLGGKAFDAERHAALCSLEVQTNFEGIRVDRQVTAHLIAELQAIAAGRLQ